MFTGFRCEETLLYGMKKINGEVIIEPIYTSPLIFVEGLAPVLVDEKIGYINISGDLVIDFYYDWGTLFNEGLAVVGTALDDG
jgi:hypothetical protein